MSQDTNHDGGADGLREGGTHRSSFLLLPALLPISRVAMRMIVWTTVVRNGCDARSERLGIVQRRDSLLFKMASSLYSNLYT